MNPSRSDTTAFLPDFCGVRMVFVVVLIAELLAIILTLVQPGYTSDRLSDLALFSLFIQWIALSSVAVLCVTRPYLNTLPDQWAALFSYLLVLLVSLVIMLGAWWLLYEWLDKQSYSNQSLWLFLGRGMGIAGIVSALALRYFYIQHQWRQQIEAETRAHIQALQSRIRPHFLFNCLNTIASLTRSAPHEAEEAIEDLADLFRVSLREERVFGTLADEIALCRRYLRIEQHRLGDRLRVHWATGTLPDQVRIPALTLQPLIENAIYHGIEQLPEGGEIHISGQHQDNRLDITIENPVPASGSGHDGSRLAQDNVRQRLLAFFGDQTRLETQLQDGCYRVTLHLPCRYENPDR